MVDLNMMLKRGKIASAKAIGNLMFHHNHHHGGHKSHVPSRVGAREYEFSCSNTPNYAFPALHFTKRKSNNTSYHNFFACTHAPATIEDDEAGTINAVKVVLEMLNNNEMMVEASPALPGFGRTPLARQLRITDSPFPLRGADDDNGYVDKAAEEFIKKFYKDLKKQDMIMA